MKIPVRCIGPDKENMYKRCLWEGEVEESLRLTALCPKCGGLGTLQRVIMVPKP